MRVRFRPQSQNQIRGDFKFRGLRIFNFEYISLHMLDIAHCYLWLLCCGESRVLPDSHSVNKETILSWAYVRLSWRTPKKTFLAKNQWLLYHDNETSHKLLLVHDFLVKNNAVICFSHRIHRTWSPAGFSSSQTELRTIMWHDWGYNDPMDSKVQVQIRKRL